MYVVALASELDYNTKHWLKQNQISFESFYITSKTELYLWVWD